MPPTKRPKTTTPTSEANLTDSKSSQDTLTNPKPEQDMVVRLNDIVDEADKDATDTITKTATSVPAESAKIDYSKDIELWRKEIIEDLRPEVKPVAVVKVAPETIPAVTETEPIKIIKKAKPKAVEVKVVPPPLAKTLSLPPPTKPFKSSPALSAATAHIKSLTGKSTKRHRLINWKGWHLYLLLGLFLATVFYSAIIWFRLDRKIPKVAEILAVPVITINNHLVTYGEFARHKLLIQRLNRWPNKRTEMSVEAAEQLAKEVIVENYILQQIARQNNLKVSDLNRDQLWENLQSEFGSKETLTRFINYNLGLSLNSYEQYVIEPYLWRLTILTHLNNDPTSHDQALRKINNLKNSIELNQINFTQAAATYS
ncbi:MAG: hypothetical protein HY973_01250, partial [Candidatus Kerfeldbacteria bacterium]|nr:hypothetical protein [Candidatus Kerfeldbacteria bacterium]